MRLTKLNNKYFSLLRRETFKIKLNVSVSLRWALWYLLKRNRINNICKILDNWNNSIPSFSSKFPFLNIKAFLFHYKYWVYWTKKMDKREKSVFSNYTPYFLINEEEMVHLDLRNFTIPILYYTYYFPYNEWRPIIIFNSIDQLIKYIKINDASNSSLTHYINSTVQAERLKIRSEIRESSENYQSALIINNESIRLNPDFIK